MNPPDSLYLEEEYETTHIAELHSKLDHAMFELAEARKQKDGAKRHKQVMIQIATPKHKPKRRQKQLRKAADARVEAAKKEGDATISKMHENLLNWKGKLLPFIFCLARAHPSTRRLLQTPYLKSSATVHYGGRIISRDER